MIPAGWFFAVAAILFGLGVTAFFVRRDLPTQFLAVEIMLNAANLAFLALAKPASAAAAQTIVLFIITVAAAEAAVGLAVILVVFRRRKSVRSEDLRILKG
ncbi:MAG: NADH-quinone oxidoreductase subunit NuoK [Acidobacteriota bacterium]|nr:NADH-quinone oxidoreductase subunit NuoK [Acidobacteriota bacterium]